MFFPEFCAACNEVLHNSQSPICIRCHSTLPFSSSEHIKKNDTYEALKKRIKIENACAYFVYDKNSLVQNIIHQIKYKNNIDLALYVGELFGHQLHKSGLYNDIDCIIPLPLHKDKLKFRGYNQAAKISQGIAKSLQKPINDKLIRRIKYTQTQTKKNRIERWNNVKDAFELIPDQKLPKHLLLIDDIATTGATLEACAKPFIDNNTKVSIAVLGRVD